MKFTYVVGIDTTVHDVQTNAVAFSRDQVWYLSSSSDTDANSVNGSRKRFTAHDPQSYYFIIKRDTI